MPCVHNGGEGSTAQQSYQDTLHIYQMCIEHHILPKLHEVYENESANLVTIADGLSARRMEVQNELDSNRDRLMRISEILNSVQAMRFGSGAASGSVRTGGGEESTGGGGGMERGNAGIMGPFKGGGAVSSEMRGSFGEVEGPSRAVEAENVRTGADEEAGAEKREVAEGDTGGEGEEIVELNDTPKSPPPSDTSPFSLTTGKPPHGQDDVCDDGNAFPAKTFKTGAKVGIRKKKRKNSSSGSAENSK